MKLTLEQAEKMMEENGGNLDLSSTQITELPSGLTVGGWLDLRHTQITELPSGLTVGGWLDLSSTQITELPSDLTVGWLDLRGTQITELPSDLTVGWLDLRGTQITDKNDYKSLKNGDYVDNKYLYADNILTHIKSCRKIKGYTFYQGKIKGKNVIFDGTNYAHCKSFKEGVSDLKFKAAKDRGAEQYKNLTLDSVLKIDELITIYRVITGACKQGTENFVKSIKDLKDEYTIKEATELTKGQYNSDVFRRFFEE